MTTRLFSWLDQWAGPFALETAVAVTLILVVALLVSWVVRRSAASLRHRVWALAVLGLLAYPLVQPLLPKLSLGLWTVSPERVADAPPVATSPAGSPSLAHHTALPVQHRTSIEETAARTNPSAVPLPMSNPQVAEDGDIRPPVAETSTQASGFHWPSILATVWAMGALVGLGFLVKVHLAAWRLVRAATEPSESTWTELTGALAAQLGVRRRVAVRISDRIAVPVTAGWLRPAILLPSDCDGWPGPRRQMVLIHEMSHVARGDVLWQIAAKLACVIYWPHPLVWLAARRMRMEREAACDDAVLRDVERPSEYAAMLLDVAASLARQPVEMSTAAIAMACGRSVEERIRWIVQPGRCRLPIDRRTARWFSVGAILLVLAVGSISIFAGPPVRTPSEPTTDGQESDQEQSQRTELATPGHVADLQGRPIANAIVTRNDSTWTATTDGDGSFPLPDLKIGQTAQLSLSAPGFLSTSQTNRSDLAVTNTGVDYVVSGGWPIELARPASISGKVIGPDGNPLAGAPLSIDTWVHLRGVSATTGNYAQTKTDAEGRFTIADIPPGSHAIYYPGDAAAKGVCGALSVTTTDGQKITGLVLDLSKSTAGVEGRVFGPVGKPMAGAHVTAAWIPPWKEIGGGTGPYPTSPVTDEDGRYKLTGLAPGKWRVRPSSPRYQRTQPSETVTLADSQTVYQDLRIVERYEPGNSITLGAAESERTNDLSKLDHAFYSIGIRSADNSLDKFNTLPVVDLFDGAANERIIDVKPLGLPANATPEQIAAAAHIGELYFLAPDTLVPINGAIVAPFTPPANRNRSYFGDMTRAEIAVQVEKHLQETPQSDGRRTTIQKDETYIVVRSDGKAYQMQVNGIGEHGASLTFFYLGHLRLMRNEQLSAAKEKKVIITVRIPLDDKPDTQTGHVASEYVVFESGWVVSSRHVYDWAHQNSHTRKLTTEELAKAQNIVRGLPTRSDKVPRDRSVSVEVDLPGEKRAVTYDRGNLPAAMKVLYELLDPGVSDQTSSSGTPMPDDENSTASAQQPTTLSNTARLNDLQITLTSDRRDYSLGENVILHYLIENRGQQPMTIDMGGDNRNNASRALRIKVEAIDQRGRVAADPYPHPGDFGGLGGPVNLKPGDQFCEDLRLMRYREPGESGTYTIKVYHDLGLDQLPPATAYSRRIGSDIPTELHKVPVVSTTIRFQMPTAEQARQVVDATLKLPTDWNRSFGKRGQPFADFSVLRYSVYLPMMRDLAESGDARGLEAIGAMAFPEATEALLELCDSKNPVIAAKAQELLLARMPVIGDSRPSRESYLADGSWQPGLKAQAMQLAWRLLGTDDREAQIRAARIVRSIGDKQDLPRLIEVMDRLLPANRNNDVEQRAWLRPASVCDGLTWATRELTKRGASPPSAADSPGRAVAFLVGLQSIKDFRPPAWHESLLSLMKSDIPFLRALAVSSTPLPLSEDDTRLVAERIEDPYLPVQAAACYLAGQSKLDRFRQPLVSLLQNTANEWILDNSFRAAKNCGAQPDRLEEILVGRLQPSNNDWNMRVLGLMIETTIKHEGGSGAQNIADWQPFLGGLQAAWRKFVEANRETLRQGRRIELGDPTITRDMFPPRYYLYLQGQPWPAEHSPFPTKPATKPAKS